MKYVRKLTPQEKKWLSEIDERYSKYGLTINNKEKKKKLLKQFKKRQQYEKAKKSSGGMTKSINRDFATAMRFKSMGKFDLAKLYINRASVKLERNKNTDLHKAVGKIISFNTTDKNGNKISEKMIVSRVNKLVKGKVLGEGASSIIETLGGGVDSERATLKALSNRYGGDITAFVYQDMKMAYEQAGGSGVAKTKEQSADMRKWFLTFRLIAQATLKVSHDVNSLITGRKKRISKLEQKFLDKYNK